MSVDLTGERVDATAGTDRPENKVLAVAQSLLPRICEGCGHVYEPWRKDQRWCSLACKRSWEHRRYLRSVGRKVEGMSAAARKRPELLERAREIARGVAREGDGTCTADDVADYMEYGLGPAAGALFRTKEWEWTGRRVPSRQPSNHARELKVWRLRTECVK